MEKVKKKKEDLYDVYANVNIQNTIIGRREFIQRENISLEMAKKFVKDLRKRVLKEGGQYRYLIINRRTGEITSVVEDETRWVMNRYGTKLE